MRVRVSELNLTLEVNGKGSALSVIDSRAIARVDVDSLIKVGAFGPAPATKLALPQTAPSKATPMTVRKRFAEQRGKRIVIR
jgi:hypothetical protein